MGKTQLNAKMGTWEEAQSYVGKELGSVQVGADKVEEGSIRRRTEAIEFDCPLHYDEKAAKKAGFKGIIAPYSMVPTYAAPPYWKPGEPLSEPGDPVKYLSMPLLTQVPAPGTLGFATDFEIEFFVPLYVGDRIRAINKLTGILPKELKIGKGAFMTLEITYKNQRDEVVALSRVGFFRFVPPKGKGELEDE